MLYLFYCLLGYYLGSIHNYVGVNYVLPIYFFFFITLGFGFKYSNKLFKIPLFLILVFVILYSNIYHYRRINFHSYDKLQNLKTIQELLLNKEIDFVLHTNIFSFNPYKALGINNNKIVLLFNKSAHFHSYGINENEMYDSYDKFINKNINKTFVIVNYYPIPKRVLNKLNDFKNNYLEVVQEVNGIKIFFLRDVKYL